MSYAQPGTSSLNIKFLTNTFDASSRDGKLNRERYLCRSQTYSRARRPNWTGSSYDRFTSKSFRQSSAKLHCYYGVPIISPSRSRFQDSYPYACSVVYDLRNYTDGTMWGPFMDDGKATVDWEKVEAVMIVLGYNLRIFDQVTQQVFKPFMDQSWIGASPDTYRSVNLLDLDSPKPKMAEYDPFNIGGSWMRVCYYFHVFRTEN
jgi:hypothetical protein